MACIGCGRGFHYECELLNENDDLNSCCCTKSDSPTGQDIPAATSHAGDTVAISGASPSSYKGYKADDKIGESAGRKRAAVKFEVNPDEPCEWRLQANCGGGLHPIVGCLTGKQQNRHHGPDKKTSNNDENNVHIICSQCIAPETLILKYDLTWVPAHTIIQGDILLGFTEKIKGNGRNVRFEKSVVESVLQVRKPAKKFYMANGKKLISSIDHQWVSSSPGRHHLGWRSVNRLYEGYNLRYLVDPWEIDNSW